MPYLALTVIWTMTSRGRSSGLFQVGADDYEAEAKGGKYRDCLFICLMITTIRTFVSSSIRETSW